MKFCKSASVVILLSLFFISSVATAGVSKGTVQAGIGVLGAVGSFFSFGAWNVSAAIHIFAIAAANDITVASHATDNNFASPVVTASLGLST